MSCRNFSFSRFRFRGARWTLLQDIRILLCPGESLAIFGTSGTGKSTLLRILAGLEQADDVSSEVWFSRKAIVFQERDLFPGTVAENVFFNGHGSSDTLSKSQRQELVDRLELGSVFDQNVEDVSAGERQRVSLARALSSSPSLLLMDEPFANLDAQLRAEVITLLEETRDSREMAIVTVTHQKEDAYLVADRFGVLHPTEAGDERPCTLQQYDDALEAYWDLASQGAALFDPLYCLRHEERGYLCRPCSFALDSVGEASLKFRLAVRNVRRLEDHSEVVGSINGTEIRIRLAGEVSLSSGHLDVTLVDGLYQCVS